MTEQERVLLTETAQLGKINNQRIADIEDDIKGIREDQKAIYSIATSVELIAQRVSHIEEKVDDTNHKVNEQTEAWRETERRLSERTEEVAMAPLKKTSENVNAIRVSIITAILTALASGAIAAVISFMAK